MADDCFITKPAEEAVYEHFVQFLQISEQITDGVPEETELSSRLFVCQILCQSY